MIKVYHNKIKNAIEKFIFFEKNNKRSKTFAISGHYLLFFTISFTFLK